MERPGATPIEWQLGYIAGFLDGEGTFDFHSGTPRVRAVNCYPATLQWLRALYGGAIRVTEPSFPNHRRVFRWRVTGQEARTLCRQVLPYLVEKRPQAALLLRIGIYPPASAMRAHLIRELSELKHIEYRNEQSPSD